MPPGSGDPILSDSLRGCSVSPSDAAEATGLNRLTILKWIRSGRLAAERIQTQHGPGYDIRPEDLTQALQTPRRKREVNPAPVKGSVYEALDAMRATLEAQGADAARREESLRGELSDLRGQLHQAEVRLTEALRALPAPKKRKPEYNGANRFLAWWYSLGGNG